MIANQIARVHEAPQPQEPLGREFSDEPADIIEHALRLAGREGRAMELRLARPLTHSQRSREVRALTALLAQEADLAGKLQRLKPIDAAEMPVLEVVDMGVDQHALLRLLPTRVVAALHQAWRKGLTPMSYTDFLEALEEHDHPPVTEEQLASLPVVETEEPTTTSEPVEDEESAPPIEMGAPGQPRIVHRRQEPPPWQEDDAGNRYPLRPDDATSYEPSRRLVNYRGQERYAYLATVATELLTELQEGTEA